MNCVHVILQMSWSLWPSWTVSIWFFIVPAWENDLPQDSHFLLIWNGYSMIIFQLFQWFCISLVKLNQNFLKLLIHFSRHFSVYQEKLFMEGLKMFCISNTYKRDISKFLNIFHKNHISIFFLPTCANEWSSTTGLIYFKRTSVFRTFLEGETSFIKCGNFNFLCIWKGGGP